MYRAKHEIHYRDAEGKSARIVANTILTDEQSAALGKATVKDLLAKKSLIEVNDDGSKVAPTTEGKKARGSAAGRTVKTEEEKAAEKKAAAEKAEAEKKAAAEKAEAEKKAAAEKAEAEKKAAAEKAGKPDKA